MEVGLNSTTFSILERIFEMNPVLFRLLAALVPLQWGQKYSLVGKSPAPWEFRAVSLAIQLKHALKLTKMVNKTNDNFESDSQKRLRQRYLAFSVPERNFTEADTHNLPPLRLLCVSHPKDFDVLTLSLRGALLHVKNPVTAIDVVSPAPDKARRVLENEIPTQTRVSFLHDNDVVAEEFRADLDRALVTHGAWAVQQLIKVLVSLRHPSEPTLVIDSDTILLRDKVWMNPEGRQLLYFSKFSNSRYGHYLRSWGMHEFDELRSFVTHHMLFQPGILEGALLSTFGSTEPRALVQAIVSSARELGFPEFSLDYEYYGNVLWSQGPEKYMLDKYSNLGLKRPSRFSDIEEVVRSLRKRGHYNSVSFHQPDR